MVFWQTLVLLLLLSATDSQSQSIGIGLYAYNFGLNAPVRIKILFSVIYVMFPYTFGNEIIFSSLPFLYHRVSRGAAALAGRRIATVFHIF
jgi:hypothetical protein